jgi:hypothetical protein
MINFNANRWDILKNTYKDWWNGNIERPIAGAILYGNDPGRIAPKTPSLTQANCHILDIPAVDIVDRLDYDLSTYEFIGDAFPYVNLDSFGPGVVAAFCGAKLDNSTGRVWFHPLKELPIEEIHLTYDPENIWLKRIKDICKEAMTRWQGQVLVGMPDLGGILDILATFRTTENLLIDLYDSPEEVKRLIKEIYHLWHQYYCEINSVLQPYNPGYSDWSRIYSDTPSYVLQSDFSYMIGLDMFEEFTKPELIDSCKKLSRSIYHLDGVGQLNHLDSLLSIKELDCIQWVPGTGKDNLTNWPEVYQKIQASGKKIQVWGEGVDTLKIIAQQIGTSNSIQQPPYYMHISQRATAYEQLKQLNIDF